MFEPSPKRNIVFKWLFWHFIEAPKEILNGWKNFLIFNLNYFSIGALLKSLFSHWHRYAESYGKGFDLKRYLNVFLGNMISRFLGAAIRIVTIIIGLACEIAVFAAGLLVFLVWFCLPIIVVGGFFYGIGLFV